MGGCFFLVRFNRFPYCKCLSSFCCCCCSIRCVDHLSRCWENSHQNSIIIRKQHKQTSKSIAIYWNAEKTKFLNYRRTSENGFLCVLWMEMHSTVLMTTLFGIQFDFKWWWLNCVCWIKDTFESLSRKRYGHTENTKLSIAFDHRTRWCSRFYCV